MYREPPPSCCVCGDAVDAHDAEFTEAGLRCRRCTEAAELAALKPALDEARAAQEAWARFHAKHPAKMLVRRPCSRHAEWSSHCLPCVLAAFFAGDE